MKRDNNHPAHTVEVLNRALIVVYRSLPMYLSEAHPWSTQGDEPACAALARLVADQQQYSGRIAEAILQRHGVIAQSSYPMSFTDLQLLAMRFLLLKLVAEQRLIVAELERCVAEVSHDPGARSLLEEVLGNQRGHLQNLIELVAQTPADSAAALPSIVA